MSLVNDIKAIQRAVGADADGIFGPVTAAAVLRHFARTDLVEAAGETPAPLDERTLRTLATLDAKAQDRFSEFTMLAKATAATYGCDYVAISGHRTWEEQNRLFAKGGVTNARGGQSNHNFGIAVDYGVFRGKTYLDSSDPALARRVHEACAVHARQMGFEWGGDWKGKFKDFPHLEISTGLSMAQKRNLYQEKGTVL